MEIVALFYSEWAVLWSCSASQLSRQQRWGVRWVSKIDQTFRPQMRYQIFTLSAIALLGCAGASADSLPVARVDTLAGGLLSVTSDAPAWRDPSRAWSLVEELRFGGDEGPGELIDPQSFAADGEGRLYVVDSKPAIIKVFDRDGSFIRAIGRDGSGPGEFRVGYIAVRNEHLILHDPQQGRTSVFDTSGTFVKSAVTFCCYWGDIMLDSAMKIVLPAMIIPRDGQRPTGVPYARYDLGLKLLDTMVVSGISDFQVWNFTAPGPNGRPQARMTMIVPWTPRTHHALHPWGGAIRGTSNEYRLVMAPNGNDSVWMASRPWTPEPIPEEQRKERLEQTIKSAGKTVGEPRARQAAKLEDLPTTSPAFTRLGVDEDGNIWVRRLIGSDSTQTTFDVLDARGAWMGSLQIPYGVAEYGGALFGKGAVYVKTEDENGRPTIVRLAVRKP